MPVYVKAQAKSVSMTPRKIGLVASLVRGRSVADALVILEHTPKRAALPVIKVIQSAKANAEHNHNVDTKDLQITTLDVTPGPRAKRFRPVARGSAHPYQKRTTHITVIVAGEAKAKKAAAKPVTKTTTATKAKRPSTEAQTKGAK
jgi:large subunit ribosomal protein L22